MLLRKEELRLYYVFYWIVPPLLHKFYGINKKKKRRKNKYIGSYEVRSGLGCIVDG